jgi:hypothetical protein
MSVRLNSYGWYVSARDEEADAQLYLFKHWLEDDLIAGVPQQPSGLSLAGAVIDKYYCDLASAVDCPYCNKPPERCRCLW